MEQKTFNHLFVTTIRQGSSASEDLLNQIKNGPKLSALRAIEVYQEDYRARLLDALKNTYRAIHILIGDEDFETIATDYLNVTASHSSDLDDYGDQFSTFLEGHALNEEYPFLAELADYEWNFREVFHLPEHLGLTASELMEFLSGATVDLILTSSARLLSYSFLISELCNLQDNQNSDAEFDYRHSEYLIMLKKGVLVKTIHLSENQWRIMKAFENPISLAEAIQQASTDVTPAEIQNLFQVLASERLLIKHS